MSQTEVKADYKLHAMVALDEIANLISPFFFRQISLKHVLEKVSVTAQLTLKITA